MSSTELYVENMNFIRSNHKSFDPLTQFCVESAVDAIKAILFSRYRF